MAIEFRDVLRPRVLAPLVVLLLAAGLAACNLPAGSDCSADDLPPVINMVPSLGAWADSLSPILTWDYEGSCMPDAYEVGLTSDEGDQSGTVDGLSEGWTPPTPLEPATVYHWYVTPVSGSTEGESAWAEFRTGPICEVVDPSAYPAPVLTSPANGAIIDTTTWVSMGPDDRAITPLVELSWEGTSGCLMPGRYEMKVSRSPSFSPSGNVSTGWTYKTHERYFFPPGVEWHDCERFYWKVTPLLGGDDAGPSSDIWSFIVNTSGVVCPAELVAELPIGPGISVPLAGHGAIAGHVWHDECAVPYESTDIAPPGCVIMPDGSIEANGILDSGESGIEGVTVRLNTGACPGTAGWTYATDASGMYTFHNLTAGTYCIEIDAAADGNDTVLIPGNWTVPYRWYGPGPISAEVTLGSDDDISRLNDFAWDYQFLPSPSGAGPSGTPLARVLTDARCRLGPGTIYPILTYLSQGFSFPIIGRNADHSWWQVSAPDVGDCWVADEVVETEGDSDSVPEQQAPPPPTVTPVMGCWQRPNPQGPVQCVVPCPVGVEQPSWCTP
jgi:SdrD B-like domain